MNRVRGPSSINKSRATPQTLCQKCLQRDKSRKIMQFKIQANLPSRHYSFECKATTQERPYTSRPSRTQQLANPKLIPSLTNEVPIELLRKWVVHT